MICGTPVPDMAVRMVLEGKREREWWNTRPFVSKTFFEVLV